MVIAQDITARRKAEAGTNQLAAIVNSSQESTVGWNWDKQVTSWNPGAERLYCWTEEEMLARSIRELMPEERQVDAEAGRAPSGRGGRLRDALRRPVH